MREWGCGAFIWKGEKKIIGVGEVDVGSWVGGWLRCAFLMIHPLRKGFLASIQRVLEKCPSDHRLVDRQHNIHEWIWLT